MSPEPPRRTGPGQPRYRDPGQPRQRKTRQPELRNGSALEDPDSLSRSRMTSPRRRPPPRGNRSWWWSEVDEAAYAMCHIAHLARGSTPSTPLLPAAPDWRSRQWNGSSPTTSAAPPSSSMRSVSGRSPPAASSHQRRQEWSACPTKYVPQAFISRRGGRWRLRPNDDADDDADEMVNRHVPHRRVRPNPLAGVGAFQHGYIRTGATPPTAGVVWHTRGYTWCHTTHLAVPRQRQ